MPADGGKRRVTALLAMALLVSLAVNILVAGFFLGAWVKSEPVAQQTGQTRTAARPQDLGASINPRQLLRVLPPETRQRVQRELIKGVAKPRRLMGETIEARRATWDALQADPFDLDRLEAAFEISRRSDIEFLASVHELTVDLMKTLTPEEREALRTAIQKRLEERQQRAEQQRQNQARQQQR